MKPIFTDFDGTKYFRNRGGKLVDKNGRLTSLAEEFNIEKHLRDLKSFEDESCKANYVVGGQKGGGK